MLILNIYHFRTTHEFLFGALAELVDNAKVCSLQVCSLFLKTFWVFWSLKTWEKAVLLHMWLTPRRHLTQKSTLNSTLVDNPFISMLQTKNSELTTSKSYLPCVLEQDDCCETWGIKIKLRDLITRTNCVLICATRTINHLMSLKFFQSSVSSQNVQSALCICRFCICGFKEPQIESIGKVWERVPKGKTWVCCLLATIYIAFT